MTEPSDERGHFEKTLERILALGGYEPVREPENPDHKSRSRPPFRYVAELRDRDGPLSAPRVVQLEAHRDPRGVLFECYREGWGDGPVRQAYLSVTHPDTVKGWHLHFRQEDRFVVVRGRVVLAFFPVLLVADWLHEHAEDSAIASAAPSWAIEQAERALGVRVFEVAVSAEGAPVRVDVPPGWAHGWYNPAPQDAWILNLCSQEYDGTDEFRCPAGDGPLPGIPHDWRRDRDG